ncbi:MAG: type II secretion system protein N [Halioglobus sp.]
MFTTGWSIALASDLNGHEGSWSLKSVFVHSNGIASSAVIVSPTGQRRYVKTGEFVAGDMRLEAVFTDRVTLASSIRQVTLYLVPKTDIEDKQPFDAPNENGGDSVIFTESKHTPKSYSEIRAMQTRRLSHFLSNRHDEKNTD